MFDDSQFQYDKNRTCGGKKIYNKRGAQTTRNDQQRRGNAILRIYPCPKGNHWHLTSAVDRFFKRK